MATRQHETDRILPCLLDRLTDDDPDSSEEGAASRRGTSLRALRDSFQRDLEWLLNTGNMGDSLDTDKYPLIASSVLNYGTPDLAGAPASGIDALGMERAMRQAILDFEPRLLKNSLGVRVYVDASQMGRQTFHLDIEGELWAEPAPEPIYLQTEIDLESGVVTVGGGSHRRSR